MNEVVNGGELVVLVFLDHVLDLGFGFGGDLSHSLENLIVDGHGVKADNDSNDFGLDFADFPKKPQLSQLRKGNPPVGLGDQHPLNNLNSLNTNIIGYVVESFNNSLVQILSVIFLKGQRPTHHPIKDDPQRPHIPNLTIVVISR